MNSKTHEVGLFYPHKTLLEISKSRQKCQTDHLSPVSLQPWCLMPTVGVGALVPGGQC